MDFAIFNRPGIEQCEYIPDYHFIISIRTPGDQNEVKLKITDKTLGVLRMDFYDINEWDRSKDPHVNPGLLFNADMARQIVEFAVKQKRDRRLQLGIAHCDAGLSRSPATIAAIQRTVFNEDPSEILNAYPTHNPRVYRGILEAWDSHLLRERLLGH